MLYSIVIPCYKSSHTIRKVVELTMAEMDRLGKTPYEFVLVDDHSPDGGDTLCPASGAWSWRRTPDSTTPSWPDSTRPPAM